MTLQKLLGSESGTEIAKLINAIIDEKASVDLDNLSQTAQALIDEKIEADALAAQNGYIKFKLNGISTPIIVQWGTYSKTALNAQAANFSLNVSFNSDTSFSIIANNYSANAASYDLLITAKTASSVTMQAIGANFKIFDWIAIGY
jgi:hypothetical protein